MKFWFLLILQVLLYSYIYIPTIMGRNFYKEYLKKIRNNFETRFINPVSLYITVWRFINPYHVMCEKFYFLKTFWLHVITQYITNYWNNDIWRYYCIKITIVKEFKKLKFRNTFLGLIFWIDTKMSKYLRDTYIFSSFCPF